jgi:hypothetical protein
MVKYDQVFPQTWSRANNCLWLNDHTKILTHVTIVVSLDTMPMNVGKISLMSPNIEDKKGNFVDREVEVSDDFKNLKLFISDVSLSTKMIVMHGS